MGEMSNDMIRYIPDLSQTAYQGQIRSTETKKNMLMTHTKTKKVIEFNILLTANHYANFQNMDICFPIKFEPAANNSNEIAVGVIAVNKFFAHWIKEIDIKRYGDAIPILPLTNAVEIYRYSDELLKYVPKNALKTFEKTLLYSKEKVIVTDNRDK